MKIKTYDIFSHHALLEKIDSVYAYEVLSPDPHFRLIFVLPFSFTYARAHKKGRTKRREMERKLRKEKWETKVSFQPPERRTHFYIVYSSIKKVNKNHILLGRTVHPTQLAL